MTNHSMKLLEVIKEGYLKKGNSVPKLSKRLGISEDRIYGLMVKYEISRRTYSEANYILHRGRAFKIRKQLSGKEKALKIAGTMLYWAEGSKASLKSGTVDLANSDPDMIKLFITFLRKICGVDEQRLRIFLYAYEDQNIESLKMFWSSVAQVPLNQFTKPYIRQRTSNKSGRKMPYGLIHVRYADKRLLMLLLLWIKETRRFFSGEVPKRPTGPDCDKQRPVAMPGGKVGEFREP